MSLATFAQSTLTTSDIYSTSTTDIELSPAVLVPIVLVWLAVLVLTIVSMWKVFEKAGRPGWAAIVPIYNSWVLLEIVGYPGWWALLAFVPIVNFFPAVMMIIAYYKLAKLFGKGTGFAVCNVLFTVVTMPILAFGKATYQGAPVAATAASTPVEPQTPQFPAPEQPQAPVAPTAPVVPTAPIAPTQPEALTPPEVPQAPTQEQPRPPQAPQGPLIQ